MPPNVSAVRPAGRPVRGRSSSSRGVPGGGRGRGSWPTPYTRVDQSASRGRGRGRGNYWFHTGSLPIIFWCPFVVFSFTNFHQSFQNFNEKLQWEKINCLHNSGLREKVCRAPNPQMSSLRYFRKPFFEFTFAKSHLQKAWFKFQLCIWIHFTMNRFFLNKCTYLHYLSLVLWLWLYTNKFLLFVYFT